MDTVEPINFSEKENTPYRHYRGYLPHIEHKQIQFLTFRLYDSVPKDVIQQWKVLLANEEEKVKNESVQEKERLRKLIDQYEDAGYGQSFLKDRRIAAVVEQSLLHFDNERYTLLRWCIMPNHVHVMMELKEGWTLSTMLRSWKSFTAHQANRILGRSGPFWMAEYYDRYVRTAEQFMRTVTYIDYNPEKACLSETPEEWEWRTKPEYLERIREYDFDLNRLE